MARCSMCKNDFFFWSVYKGKNKNIYCKECLSKKQGTFKELTKNEIEEKERNKDIRIGVYWLIGGIIASILSPYYIYLGLIIYGCYRIIKNLIY